MRIGASVILLDGFCYQSYQWKFLRPLGSLKHVLKFLDLYHVDEICITRPIKKNDSDVSLLNDLHEIQSSPSNSPISFGGGIRNLDHLKFLKNVPIERLHFSTAFTEEKLNLLKKSRDLFGKQAIVASLPVKLIDDHLYVYSRGLNRFERLKQSTISLIHNYADELMVIDVDNEGCNETFNFKILESLDFPLEQIVISGGVGPKIIAQARDQGIASCLIENRVLHHENYMRSET